MKKRRTRTNIVICVFIYLAVAVGYVLYGWAEKGRSGADLIITSLLGSGVVTAITHWLTVGWENIKGKK